MLVMWSIRSSMQLVSHHVAHKGLFEGSRLSAWLETMGYILEYLVSMFGSKSGEGLLEMVVKQRLHAMDGNVNLSPTQDLLFHLLEKAWGRKVKGLLLFCPPSCPLGVLSWTFLFPLLSRATAPGSPGLDCITHQVGHPDGHRHWCTLSHEDVDWPSEVYPRGVTKHVEATALESGNMLHLLGCIQLHLYHPPTHNHPIHPPPHPRPTAWNDPPTLTKPK